MKRHALAMFLFVVAGYANAEGGIFVGSTPCGPAVKQFLGLPADRCDVIRWELSLGLDAKNASPGPAAVDVEYGVDGRKLKKLHRPLTWELSVGAREHKDANVIELKRGKASLFLWKVTDETLYFLDAKRRTLVGNAAFSYALSVAVIDKLKPAAAPPPDIAWQRKPPSTGATVFGVFEGRTPCDLATRLKLEAPAGCRRVQWRLTLFQDARSRALTNYRLEGSLLGATPREGAISLLDGTPFDPTARVIRLDSDDAEPLYLMRGDDVLFFLDAAGKLALGDRDSNYVLNRAGR